MHNAFEIRLDIRIVLVGPAEGDAKEGTFVNIVTIASELGYAYVAYARHTYFNFNNLDVSRGKWYFFPNTRGQQRVTTYLSKHGPHEPNLDLHEQTY